MTPGPASGTRRRPGTVPTGTDGPPPAARRVALPAGDAIDPWDLAGDDDGILLAEGGRLLVGLGCAFRLELAGGLDDAGAVAAASTRLAALTCDDHLAPGTTPLRPVLALGALPFDRSGPAALVVPEVLYCREPDGSEWATVVAGPDGRADGDDPSRLRARLADRSGPGAAATGPTTWRIRPRGSDADFEARVSRAVAAIGRHEVDKVVLARRVDVTASRSPDIAALLRRWASLEPSCTLFSVPTPDGQFVGASPELLVERVGTRVRCRPLAGTTDRDHGSASPLPPELLESAKDTEEHRLVVNAIRDALAPWTDELDVPVGPELVHLRNITHLGTTIEGTLRPDHGHRVPSVLALVALLHPTPAVGGVPRAAALDLIDRLEQDSRGPYAGAVGWMDGAGDGRWVVGIRAMTVSGATVSLTAGVGIVRGSRPDVERRETDLKFTAVFDALAPGVPFDTSAPPAALSG